MITEVPAWAKAIRRARKKAGLTQESFAERVEVATSTVQRWESGLNRPRVPQIRAICGVFALSPDQLAFVESEEEADEMELNRRQLLKFGALAGGAAFIPFGLQDPERYLTMLGEGPVDMTYIEDVWRFTEEVSRRSHTESPASLLPAMDGHLSGIQSNLNRSQPPAIQKELHSQAGQAARLAGWLCFLLANESHAITYYGRARRSAREAGDGVLEARVLVADSLIRSGISEEYQVKGGSSPVVMQELQEALRLAGPGAAPRLVSWIRERIAEESAALGLESDMLRNMQQADRVIGSTPLSEDVPRGKAWDEAWLQAYWGGSYLILGKPELARRMYEQALEGMNPELDYDRCVALTNLGSACARMGEIDLAVGHLSEAHDLAKRNRLAGRANRIHKIRTHSLPSRGAVVTPLDERLATYPTL